MKKKIILLLSIVLLIFTSCGSKQVAVKESKIKEKMEPTWMIGQICTLTGEEEDCELIKKGEEIAIEQINEAGGISDSQISFISLDDENNIDKAKNDFNTLKDWGMQILICNTSNEIGQELIKMAEENNIYVITSTIDNEIENANNLTEVGITIKNRCKAIAEYLSSRTRNNGLTIIYDYTDRQSQEISNVITQNAKSKNLNITEKIAINPTNTERLAEIILKLKEDNIKNILLPLNEDTLNIVLSEMKENDIEANIYTTTDTLRDEYKDINIIYYFSEFDCEDNNYLIKNYRKDYYEKYEEEPTLESAEGYDEIFILKKLIEEGQVSITDNDLIEKIEKSKTSIRYNGVTGKNMKWDELGILTKDIKVYRYFNGKYICIN